jgi:hypothetical protein
VTLDRKGYKRDEMWGDLDALWRLRITTITGVGAKAKAAYQDFLTIWKDADPNIPISIAAEAEYAKLNSFSCRFPEPHSVSSEWLHDVSRYQISTVPAIHFSA